MKSLLLPASCGQTPLSLAPSMFSSTHSGFQSDNFTLAILLVQLPDEVRFYLRVESCVNFDLLSCRPQRSAASIGSSVTSRAPQPTLWLVDDCERRMFTKRTLCRCHPQLLMKFHKQQEEIRRLRELLNQRDVRVTQLELEIKNLKNSQTLSSL